MLVLSSPLARAGCIQAARHVLRPSSLAQRSVLSSISSMLLRLPTQHSPHKPLPSYHAGPAQGLTNYRSNVDWNSRMMLSISLTHAPRSKQIILPSISFVSVPISLAPLAPSQSLTSIFSSLLCRLVVVYGANGSRAICRQMANGKRNLGLAKGWQMRQMRQMGGNCFFRTFPSSCIDIRLRDTYTVYPACTKLSPPTATLSEMVPGA